MKISNRSQLRSNIYDNVKEGLNEKKIVNMLTEYFIQRYDSNSISEYEDFFVKLLSINPEFFCNKCYPNIIKELVKRYPEKEILAIERNITENNFLVQKIDEYIVTDFVGTFIINLWKGFAFLLAGHIFLTNYRIFCPFAQTLIKGKLASDNIFNVLAMDLRISPTVFGMVGQKLRDEKIEKKSEELKDIFQAIMSAQRPEIQEFLFAVHRNIPYTLPYSIRRKKFDKFSFWMNFKIRIMPNKINFEIIVNKYKNETKEIFTKRKEVVILTIRELFSRIPETVCPKCDKIQDKRLNQCQRCGKPLLNKE